MRKRIEGWCVNGMRRKAHFYRLRSMLFGYERISLCGKSRHRGHRVELLPEAATAKLCRDCERIRDKETQ